MDERGIYLKQILRDTLGHRYALIAPQYSNIQFGYCGHVTIGKNCESKNPSRQSHLVHIHRQDICLVIW